MKGKKVVAEFLAWLEALECGTDLITQDAYRVPTFSRRVVRHSRRRGAKEKGPWIHGPLLCAAADAGGRGSAAQR